MTPAEASPFGIIETIIQDICGFSVFDVDKDSSLESLGADSLLSIESEQRLRQVAGISIGDDHDIISELTVGDLEKFLLENISSHSASPVVLQSPPSSSMTHALISNPTTKLQDGYRSKSRVYLFHDGSGLSNQYARIGVLGCELYGVSSLDFASIDLDINDLKDFAAQYISVLQLTNHEQDIILGGKPLKPIFPNSMQVPNLFYRAALWRRSCF
ncbi:hypothetical protein P280DRAFT_521390 [Massarina eburnea CBS 473.64]|uniref:Carrier domain-containing protein n=1 Tax=Massarina eburnea CBS 473.64 TaxID=1395130 RepID=A0A6A6RPD6_9PLEO|nr:hypothetical protein P280DRAFT_521390 [Massarina eburnea CBS 473.64]